MLKAVDAGHLAKAVYADLSPVNIIPCGEPVLKGKILAATAWQMMQMLNLDDLSRYGLACLVLLPVQGLQPVRAEPGQGDEASEAIHVHHHPALVD